MTRAQKIGSLVAFGATIPIVLFVTPHIGVGLGRFGFCYMVGNIGSNAGAIIAGLIVLRRQNRKLARLRAELDELSAREKAT